MKKLRIVLLTIILVFTEFLGTNYVYAKEKKNSIDNEIFVQICGFLDVVKPEGYDDIFISQSFAINDAEDKDSKLIFVFEKDKCIGELVYSKINSSFFQEKCELVNELYKKDERVAIWATKESLEICTATNRYTLWGDITSQECEFLDEEYLTPISVSKLQLGHSIDNKKNQYRDTQSNYLCVPIVASATSPDTNIGLCWLACCLSMINYRIGDTGYTVIELYNNLKSEYPYTQYGYPTGTVEFFLRTFDLFNITAVHYDYGLTFNETKNMIDSNRPVIAVINSYDSTYVHAVVIDGYSKSTSTGLVYYYYYRLMDPNCSNYVIVSAPSTGINFTYNAGNITYISWTSSYTFLYQY